MRTKQMHGSALRWGLATVVAAAMASAPPSALGARTGPAPSAVPRPIKGVTLEVKIAPGLVEAADLRRWIDEDGRRVLDGLPDDPTRRGSLRIEVGGALYEYQVTITTLRDGGVVGTPSTWECDCSNEELLDRLRGELPAVAEGLAVAVEEPVVEEPVVVVTPEPVVVDEPQRRRLGPAGAAGVTLMVLGVTGVGAGTALMVLKEQQLPLRLGKLASHNFTTPGQLMLVGGGGILLTGALLYFLRKRIDRKEHRITGAIVPSFGGHNRAQLTLTGRF